MFRTAPIPLWLRSIPAAAAVLAAPVVLAAEYGLAENGSGGWGATFSEVLRSFDVVAFVLLAVLIVIMAMAGDLLNHLRIGKLVPEELLAEVQGEMANGEYEKALELCGKSDCLIGQIFSASLTKVDYSFDRMEEAMRSELEIQSLVWRQWVRQFKILTALGPMLGLAGAIVNLFRLVSDSTGRPNFSLALASSFEMRMLVYNLLAALLIGIVMGVFALGVYAFASSKLEKILVEARRLGEEILDPFRPLPLNPEE